MVAEHEEEVDAPEDKVVNALWDVVTSGYCINQGLERASILDGLNWIAKAVDRASTSKNVPGANGEEVHIVQAVGELVVQVSTISNALGRIATAMERRLEHDGIDF